MGASEYSIHLDTDRMDRLWDSDSDTEAFPFGEDLSDIEAAIEEVLGPPRRRGRAAKR